MTNLTSTFGWPIEVSASTGARISLLAWFSIHKSGFVSSRSIVYGLANYLCGTTNVPHPARKWNDAPVASVMDMSLSGSNERRCLHNSFVKTDTKNKWNISLLLRDVFTQNHTNTSSYQGHLPCVISAGLWTPEMQRHRVSPMYEELLDAMVRTHRDDWFIVFSLRFTIGHLLTSCYMYHAMYQKERNSTLFDIQFTGNWRRECEAVSKPTETGAVCCNSLPDKILPLRELLAVDTPLPTALCACAVLLGPSYALMLRARDRMGVRARTFWLDNYIDNPAGTLCEAGIVLSNDAVDRIFNMRSISGARSEHVTSGNDRAKSVRDFVHLHRRMYAPLFIGTNCVDVMVGRPCWDNAIMSK